MIIYQLKYNSSSIAVAAAIAVVVVVVVVVILFPTECKQWRTEYMSNSRTTRKPQKPMILLVVTRETKGSWGWQLKYIQI